MWKTPPVDQLVVDLYLDGGFSVGTFVKVDDGHNHYDRSVLSVFIDGGKVGGDWEVAKPDDGVVFRPKCCPVIV